MQHQSFWLPIKTRIFFLLFRGVKSFFKSFQLVIIDQEIALCCHQKKSTKKIPKFYVKIVIKEKRTAKVMVFVSSEITIYCHQIRLAPAGGSV